MKLKKVKIYEYKGIKDVELNIQNNVMYIVSDNNVGKTRLLKAIDNFFNGKDSANIEIYYEFDDVDLAHISNNYNLNLNAEEIFKQDDKKIYRNSEDYTSIIKNDKLLGKCFYIPTIVDISNEQDFSKAKNQLSNVIIDLITDDVTLKNTLSELNKSYNDYVIQIKDKSKYLFEDINKFVLFDNLTVDIDGKKISDNQLVKSNLTLKYTNHGEEVDLSDYGTGVQVNIVNSILTNLPRNQYTIILYDEPESFLNSTAQKKLVNKIFENLSNSLYMIATHSPFIIRRSNETFKSIIRLKKIEGDNIMLFQYDDKKFKDNIKQANKELRIYLNNNSNYYLNDNVYKTILSWWETDRVNSLFENKVILVEGPTETVFFDMCCNTDNYPVINTIGKFKIPYFKIFLEDILGIEVFVMYDKDDEDEDKHLAFNTWIKNNCANYLELNKDLESELGYTLKSNERSQKPQIFMEKLLNNEINQESTNLKSKIQSEYNRKDSPVQLQN